MKSTGIVRKLDDLGKVTIPVEIRKALKLYPGDDVEISSDAGSVIITPHQPACLHCGGTDELLVVDGKAICRDCARRIAYAVEHA